MVPTSLKVALKANIVESAKVPGGALSAQSGGRSVEPSNHVAAVPILPFLNGEKASRTSVQLVLHWQNTVVERAWEARKSRKISRVSANHLVGFSHAFGHACHSCCGLGGSCLPGYAWHTWAAARQLKQRDGTVGVACDGCAMGVVGVAS